MAVRTVTFRCYRGGVDGNGDAVLGTQVDNAIAVSYDSAAGLPQTALMFIDPNPPESGTYFITGQSGAAAYAFSTNLPVLLLATGP